MKFLKISPSIVTLVAGNEIECANFIVHCLLRGYYASQKVDSNISRQPLNCFVLFLAR